MGSGSTVILKTGGVLTFWCMEMEDVSIFLEHVHFLHSGNGLHVQFLKSTLQFFVILDATLVCSLDDFTAWCSFAACIEVPQKLIIQTYW